MPVSCVRQPRLPSPTPLWLSAPSPPHPPPQLKHYHTLQVRAWRDMLPYAERLAQEDVKPRHIHILLAWLRVGGRVGRWAGLLGWGWRGLGAWGTDCSSTSRWPWVLAGVPGNQL